MNNKPYPRAIYEPKPSKIVPGQIGLFALVNFTKGDVVTDSSNWDESRLITWEEFETIDFATKQRLINFCYKSKDGIEAPQDINKINIAYYFNHSCDPLTYCDAKGNYIALKDIKVGEELTIDVEKLMAKPTFPFNCSCGSKNCRKIVKI